MDNNPFEKLQPYTDAQAPEAIERIIALESFPKLCALLYPTKTIDEVANMLRSLDNIYDIQRKFSIHMVERIIDATTDGVTSSGVESVQDSNTKGYVFIANHRDIVLDSAFLQTVLVKNNLPTTQITVGDNLMIDPLFIDLAKLNKMFTLIRGGSKIRMYKNAILHSDYIRNLITNQKESLWIAQRDGRTKDGNDTTQQGLIKMLIGNRKDIIPALKELNIVPVTISYEFEPCAISKARETYISNQKDYEKRGNEDMNSVMAGFTSYKGKIHLDFGKPITPTLDKIANSELPNTEVVDLVVNELDKQFYSNFKLWPNNYIAYDIISNSSEYISKYTSKEKETFEKYIAKLIDGQDIKDPSIKKLLLGIYANPVINFKKVSS